MTDPHDAILALPNPYPRADPRGDAWATGVIAAANEARHLAALPSAPDQRHQEALDSIARAEKVVDDLCQGRLRWEMRVPAEPDHDPDLIISDALAKARRALSDGTR